MRFYFIDDGSGMFFVSIYPTGEVCGMSFPKETDAGTLYEFDLWEDKLDRIGNGAESTKTKKSPHKSPHKKRGYLRNPL
jgi:hypothetical protein